MRYVIKSTNKVLSLRKVYCENAKLDYVDSAFPANTDHEASFLVESATQTEWLSQVKEKRKYFIDQATCSKNCYRYT